MSPRYTAVSHVFLVVAHTANGEENLGAFLTRQEANTALGLLRRVKTEAHIEQVEIGIPQDVGLKVDGDKLVAADGRDVDQIVQVNMEKMNRAPLSPEGEKRKATYERKLKKTLAEMDETIAAKAAQRAKDRHEARMSASRRAVNAARRAKARAAAQVSA